MRPELTPLVMLWFLLLPAPAPAQDLSCPGLPEVIVNTEDTKSIVEICLAADMARRILSGYGLYLKRPVFIDTIEERVDSKGYLAYGSYDSRTDRIQMMSYSAILSGTENPQMYDEPFDRVHYSGAIAHELTHAVMQHNQTYKPISIGPQEYLAHSVQLAVMPKARRDAVIKAMDVAPWESGDVISDAYMALQPGRFAAKSYQHLTTMKDPLSFVLSLLNAKWFYVTVP